MRRRNWRVNDPGRARFTQIALALLVFNTQLLSLQAQPPGYPVPPPGAHHLFYLQRTPNTNTIMCELNLKNGSLDTDDPVHVYWIRYQERGQKAELNYIQRKFAYGMKTKKLAENNYEISFVSYKKYKMLLKPGADGRYHVFSKINQREVILTRMYLSINGGSFWSPNVEYVQVTGFDPVTRQEVQERIKI